MDLENNTYDFLDQEWMNETNSTLGAPPAWRKPLAQTNKVILSVNLLLMMIAMGCNTHIDQVKKHLRYPVPFAICFFAQVIMLPLFAFSLAHGLGLSREHSLGLLIISTCPGGTISNVCTYYVKGDVSLSVSMTVAATLAAFGTMPFNLWLYSRSWTSDDTTVPYVNIVITLVSILGPVIVGMLIKWKSLKAAKIITKAGTIGGLVLISMTTVVLTVLYPAILWSGWKTTLATVILPAAGFSVGYLAAFLLRRTPEICRTIGMETGFQNVGTAMYVTILSFQTDKQGEISAPTILYSITMIGEGFLFCLVFNWLLRRKEKKMLRAVDTVKYAHPEQDDPNEPDDKKEELNSNQG